MRSASLPQIFLEYLKSAKLKVIDCLTVRLGGKNSIVSRLAIPGGSVDLIFRIG
jgi:hypothetical protein